MGQIFIFLNKK